ncbi:sperm axonemal maintenance protein CFAP97D1 [Tachysurus vachellii]|nr:sperm axonemal maintenance protein CFAP97D1 [Tachysurus vachellii]
MHKAYQPLKPAANKYLQKKWDQDHYDEHRKKVTEAKPIVDTKGIRTPTHIQAKLKKAQVQEERQAVIDRDNQLLASKIADIQLSKGRIDHRNFYPARSLNSESRRIKLLEVAHENQAIYERITAQESEYRRELWQDDWVRIEQRREGITRYPHGVAHKQKITKKKSVKFFGGTSGQTLCSSSRTQDGETTDEDLRHQ